MSGHFGDVASKRTSQLRKTASLAGTTIAVRNQNVFEGDYVMKQWRCATQRALFAIALSGGLGSAIAAGQDGDRPVITAPTDGTWCDTGDIPLTGDASTPNASIEVQVLNIDSQTWQHAFNVTTHSDGFERDGQTRYGFSVPLGVGPASTGEADYTVTGVGPTRADGQRSNALYITLYGWGDGPQREAGHYVSIYETCGKRDQACCQRSNACDAGSACNYKSHCEAAQSNPTTPTPTPTPGASGANFCVRLHMNACYDIYEHLLEPPTPSCVDACASDFVSASNVALNASSVAKCDNSDVNCCDMTFDQDTSWCGY
jgi:hypothetical protein